MYPCQDFFELLNAVTVDCKDNGEHFVVDDRIQVIERLLQNTPYKLIAREPLALLFAKRKPRRRGKTLLISSHIDCVYNKCFCRDEGDCFRGTFDNSFGNAAVLWCMMNDTLPENTVVAFTGDEEKDSGGALQTMLALGRMGCRLTAIVQDVTKVGWGGGALFTIENDSGFSMLTSYNVLSSLMNKFHSIGFEHNAEPDESWDYAERGIPCLTFCAPIYGDMHSDEGVLLRKESAVAYCDALAHLASLLA